MTRRRSKLEIYLDVLWAIKEGTTKPTRIMYSANLSWNPLQKILDSMLEQGLIAEVEVKGRKIDRRTPKTYNLTQKGDNVLKYFSQAEKLLTLEETTGLD